MMIRAILCFATLVFLVAHPACAQVQERRGFVGIGIGPSIPVGNFADVSPANDRAGHAKAGYTNTFLNFGYRFGERLGVAAALSYSEYYTDGAGDDDWWQVSGFTIGPMYSLSLGAKGAVDLKGMLGVMATAEVVDSYTPGGRNGSGLMIDLRTAFRYDVFRRWCVFVEGGVISSAQTLGDGSRKDVRALISGLGVAFRPMW